jgi:hypothetical protein
MRSFIKRLLGSLSDAAGGCASVAVNQELMISSTSIAVSVFDKVLP